MLECGIKSITTNPTLITKSSEIIRLVDSRNHKTRAFVLPIEYEPLIVKLEKELELKRWIESKKSRLKESKSSENFDDIMEAGIKSIQEYVKEV